MIRHLLAPALVALALVTPAAGGEPTERLRTLFDEANRILLAPDSDTALEERVTAIRALLNEAFDARESAALALGREWQARTPAERDEFVRLYAELVERAYLGWIGSRARVHGNGVRIAFESESVHGEHADVVTTLQTRGGGEMPVAYRMHRRDGRWLVRDVLVDGLSLAESYRAQVHRVMQTGGYPELIERLHEKASNETRIAIMKARGTRVAGAAATAPVRVASAATATDAPPVRVAGAATATDAPPVSAPMLAMPLATSPPHVTPSRAAVVVSSPPTQALRPAAIVTPAEPAAPEPPAPVVMPAPAASTMIPSARRRFWIQVGAFRDTDAASRLVERLRRHSVTVATGGPRSTPLARVLVGPFTNRSAAAAMLRELTAGGYRAFIAFE